MRILVYYPGDLTRATGTPIRALALSAACARAGAEIILCATCLPPDFFGKTLEVRRSRRDTVRRLLGAIADGKPDVILGITHNAARTGSLASRLARRPFVLDVHSLLDAELKATGGSLAKRLRAAVAHRLGFRRCTAFVAVSRPLARRLERYRRPVRTIWGGVDISRFNPAVEADPEIVRLRPPRGLLVGYVGNLRGYQGVDFLVEAARSVVRRDSRIAFVLVGDGPLKQVLSGRLTQEIDEASIHLRAARPHDAIPSVLAACDVLVVPRPSTPVTEFAFASKLPEYLAMGRTVIATDVGDASALIKHGRSGFLVPPGDVGALERLLLSLLEDAQVSRLGATAAQAASERHTWDVRAQELLQFLEEVS